MILTILSRVCAVLLLGGLLGAPLSHLSAQSEIVDGVAAIVNDEVITISEVREVVAPREQALRQVLSGQELVDKVKEARLAALKDLIDRKLVLQEFRKKEFKLPPYHIENNIEVTIREEYGGDRKAFLRDLNAKGVSLNQYREREKERMIVMAMQQARGRNMPLISPQRVEVFYKENKAQYTSEPRVKLRLIAINKTDDTSKAYVDEIHAKLKEGAAFDKLAQMYSEDPSRDLGGDWGWVDTKTLNDKLTKIVFSIEAKKVSRIYEEDGVYYIFYLDEKEPAVTKPLAEVREDIKRRLEQEERQKMYDQWINSLRETAYIKMY